MQTRPLGKTGLNLPILSFGASSLGAEFRAVDVNEALRSVHVALENGMNFIDTSPYYGRGMSEVLLGVALEGVPRDSYTLCTKLGRYAPAHFDFSPRRVEESIDVSLERMRTDHLDVALLHDVEFVDLDYVVNETLPALRRQQQKGKVRFVGVSGYPMKMFKYVADRARQALSPLAFPTLFARARAGTIARHANPPPRQDRPEPPDPLVRRLVARG